MKRNTPEHLLSWYLRWGGLSSVFLTVFIMLLSYTLLVEQTDIALYFVLLLSGFLWIGATAVSRHVYVLLKKMLGKKITVLEFLSTQFIALLLPFFYMKLRKEIRNCHLRMTSDTGEGAE